AWALLLHHYSQQYEGGQHEGKQYEGEQHSAELANRSNSVVFGATRACRYSSVAGAETMVGLLINTLPVRVHLTPDISIGQWLQNLRKQHLAVRLYEHTPLTQIRQCSELPSNLPLFESLVVFENSDWNSVLRSSSSPFHTGTIHLIEQPSFPLVLLGTLCAPLEPESPPELELKIWFDVCRFTESTIAQLLDRLVHILEQMMLDPEQPLGHLSRLTATERQQILVDWNATDVDYPRQLCLQDLFEAQVARSPDAIAVKFADRALTYAELNQRANQLAHYLQTQGVQPEVPVGICIERSLEMVVGLMAILKAGGAYVPLDPTYPTDRLFHILTDAQIPLILTQNHLAALFAPSEVPLICLDRDWQTIATQPQTSPNRSVQSTNLAYIIYTSGSTGKPKGVLIEHRGAVNTILDVNRRFQVNAQDRVLAICSLNFDLSVYDIFGLLAAGGTIVLPPPSIAPDLPTWIELMHREQVTLWNSAPPVMQLFAGYLR
ncbi:MAG TPA: AMP-binding protein, partial [Allocoleopsis sp.]